MDNEWILEETKQYFNTERSIIIKVNTKINKTKEIEIIAPTKFLTINSIKINCVSSVEGYNIIKK